MYAFMCHHPLAIWAPSNALNLGFRNTVKQDAFEACFQIVSGVIPYISLHG